MFKKYSTRTQSGSDVITSLRKKERLNEINTQETRTEVLKLIRNFFC